jgi:Zn-dependent M28 family amino/carboxypeptidase
MASFPLETKHFFVGNFKERDFFASNVIGMISGRDPKLKDSYIIVSAHYDHLGIGEAIRGDLIYNDVLDNAMGCASLLEIARVFSQYKVFIYL